MTAILAALGLLTRLPLSTVGAVGSRAGGRVGDTAGAAAFPLVGALIGAVGGAVCLLLGSEPVIAAILAVGAMALLSGGLHLDGLADTVDALLAPDPVRAEAARKDPAVGAGGAVALIVVIGTQAAALASLVALPSGPWLAASACVLAAATGRAVPVVVVALSADRWTGRSDLVSAGSAAGGFGQWFRARVRTSDALVAVASVVALLVAAGLATGQTSLVLGTVIGAAVGIVALVSIAARRRGLDGDGFGAAIEVSVAAVLVSIAVLT